jgi:hypothetical protein
MKFKRGYQSSSNLMKDGNGNLLAGSHSILNGWKNCFSRLVNVHRVSDIKHVEVHTAELLLPDPSPLRLKFLFAKLKRCKLPGSDQIQAELIRAGGETLQPDINKLILFV